MSELFRNSSPNALTLRQAIALEKERRDQRRRAQQAEQLAAAGRGGDTEIAPVARGEIVLPVQLQNDDVLNAIQHACRPYGVPIEMLKVGNALNSINQNTGAPEFGVMDWISGLFGGKTNASAPNATDEHDGHLGEGATRGALTHAAGVGIANEDARVNYERLVKSLPPNPSLPAPQSDPRREALKAVGLDFTPVEVRGPLNRLREGLTPLPGSGGREQMRSILLQAAPPVWAV